MKGLNIRFSLIFAFLAMELTAWSQQEAPISDYIVNDSGRKVTIEQPNELYERLRPENGDPSNGEPKKNVNKHVVGYRIQIFSDNNHRTAKSEAQVKERNIAARFPQLGTYLQYKAPAWRLRVGDFRTRGEATEMLKQIKRAFPAYSSEMTVVMDRINPLAL